MSLPGLWCVTCLKRFSSKTDRSRITASPLDIACAVSWRIGTLCENLPAFKPTQRSPFAHLHPSHHSSMEEEELGAMAAAPISTPALPPPLAPPSAPPPDLCPVCGQRHLQEENHEYNYRDEVDDDLMCHICLQPFVRPLDTPCGHTYCQECLTSFLLESDFCPMDRKPLMLQSCRHSSLLVLKLLDKLAVSCPFPAHCDETLPRGELQDHLKHRENRLLWLTRVAVRHRGEMTLLKDRKEIL
ncbi:hypothetical protein ACEWY4_014562 [Coilia grayii]|uniref:RING-type domain-containing protein n=1 Tax=Coilia grayii TaxID=363190 RepID=A0ABD1JSM4_9TELE